jgi:hypothetical protein
MVADVFKSMDTSCREERIAFQATGIMWISTSPCIQVNLHYALNCLKFISCNNLNTSIVFFFLYKIVPFNSMKAYRGTRSIIALILKLDREWTSCLDLFTQLNVRMGGPTGGRDVLKKGNFHLYCNAHFSLSDKVRMGLSA